MKQSYDYRLYGVSLRSEIPLTFAEHTIAAPDIILTIEPADWFEKALAGAAPVSVANGWYYYLECQDGSDYLQWPGLFEFTVSADGRAVACRALERSSPESLQTYLLGQVLSFALIKQGAEPLHATAVVIEGVAVAFLGPSGQGKSTLAAAFLRSGYRVLTDDLFVIRDIGGVLCAFPGPPRIKLFPEVAERFIPDQASLAPMNPDTPKAIIALDAGAAHTGPVPIHAFLILDGIEGEGDVEIAPFSSAASCVELLGAAFNRRRRDHARLRRQFEAARDWADRIPAKRLRYTWNVERIDDVVSAVVEDVNVARASVI